jgi:hypothetical protein
MMWPGTWTGWPGPSLPHMPSKSAKTSGTPPTRDGAKVIAAVLAASKPRPTQKHHISDKIKYATRFADSIAEHIAEGLKPLLKGIEATTKRSAGSVFGKKQLDVNFSTPQVGLALGISLKSVHIRDVAGSQRYTHNRKRNEEELRIEAAGYHKRQPYAVMVGVLFLPFDSCDDGKKEASSFGSWVRHLRPYTGRDDPDDEIDKFEKIFIALYEPDASDMRFFDVQWDPPKNGRPKRLLTYAEFLDATYHAYLRRNAAEFKWAEGEEEPLDVEEEEFGDDEEA